MWKLPCTFLFFCLTWIFHPVNAQSNINRVNRNVFFKETFNWGNPADPKGWTMPAGYYLEDPDDTGLNWHWWPDDSLACIWITEPPLLSTSKEDGHLCLFGALYNVAGYPRTLNLIPTNNSIVSPPIDCSQHSSVILQFETNFMNRGIQGSPYTAGRWKMIVEVSPDNGYHWNQWDASFGVPGNQRPSDIDPGQVIVFRENLSEVAAGRSLVRIRITWYNWYGLYFWNIDDLQLIEAPAYDLRMDSVDVHWDSKIPFVDESISYMMPISQLGKGHAFYGFGSKITNMGAEELINPVFTVTIKHEEVTVFEESKTISAIFPGYKDSLDLEGKYEPKESGTYSINYQWKLNQEDDFPADNIKTLLFKVSDSVYNRAGDKPDYVFKDPFYAADLWDENYNRNHFMGSIFPIYGDCEIDGIAAYITGGQADSLIDFDFTVWEAKYDWFIIDPQLLMRTDRLVLDSSMINTWVYLPFTKNGESEFIKAGSLLWAGLEHSNYHTDEKIRKNKGLSVGGTKQVPYHNAVAKVARPNFFSSYPITWADVENKNLMIRLYLHSTANATDPVNSTSFSISQNYPNPFLDHTGINYSLGQDAAVRLEILDLTGQVVFRQDEGPQPAGSHQIQIQRPGLSPGIYFYTLIAGVNRQTRKMIVVNQK